MLNLISNYTRTQIHISKIKNKIKVLFAHFIVISWINFFLLFKVHSSIIIYLHGRPSTHYLNSIITTINLNTKFPFSYFSLFYQKKINCLLLITIQSTTKIKQLLKLHWNSYWYGNSFDMKIRKFKIITSVISKNTFFLPSLLAVYDMFLSQCIDKIPDYYVLLIIS